MANMGKAVMNGVTTVMAVVIITVISALVVGTILTQTVFSSLTIINTTQIEGYFAAFVVGLLGFLSIIGLAYAISWLVGAIRPIFSKEEGIQSFSGN